MYLKVVVKENKVNKAEEEAVPAWFKSYMDRVCTFCVFFLKSFYVPMMSLSI